MSDEKPHYRHDCERCRYLGTFRAHDLYFCRAQESHLGMPTVIARYGNEGPEYVSGLALAAVDPILMQAVAILETGESADWIVSSPIADYARTEGMFLARSCTELVEAVFHARKRAEVWKRTAKRLWLREMYKFGRHGCAAIDVRMKRNKR